MINSTRSTWHSQYGSPDARIGVYVYSVLACSWMLYVHGLRGLEVAPGRQLHSPMVIQVLVHIEGIP